MNLKDMSMEEKKQGIQIIMGMLKNTLIDCNLAIAFDKTNNKFLFLDRDIYINEKKAKGFEIDFKELTYQKGDNS